MTAASGNVRCLDVYNISLDDGANICQWEYRDGSGQKFFIEPVARIMGDVNTDGKFSKRGFEAQWTSTSYSTTLNAHTRNCNTKLRNRRKRNMP